VPAHQQVINQKASP